ncbi:MAG: D-glycero-beta-D-manno-heptose-7-phosphate kinase [Bacteroidetes bacterium]|nr:D-glycero-beta-D-manno-heptose-7-phosphate kinase [Bacteroidota bacterium]
MTQQNLRAAFAQFANKKILVTGDLMLDAYWWGKVERISPEAPVPVVHINKREYRLGGAANVALNLKMLGAQPILCSVVGNDAEAKIFKDLLATHGLSADGIITDPNRPTTVKTRVIGNKNQLLRIDNEETEVLDATAANALLNKLMEFLPQAAMVLFEDYDKGVLEPTMIEKIITAAKQQNIPTVVDPKKKNFLAYNGVTLFKPNLRELAEGLKLDINSSSSNNEIEEGTKILLQKLGAQYAMVTLSERGTLISSLKETHIVPAHIRSIYDVSGAGDTVVSVAALALLAGLSIKEIAALSNLAGGLVCEKAGVVPITKEELLEAAIREI